MSTAENEEKAEIEISAKDHEFKAQNTGRLQVYGIGASQGQGAGTVRHLEPVNLSPLKRRMKKQLYALKEINAKGFPEPPFEHRQDSRYLRSLVVKGDDA